MDERTGRSSPVDGGLQRAKRAWRKLAPQSLRGLAQPVVAALSEQRVWSALAAPEPDPRPGPLILSGLLSETKGVSEAARLTLMGLRHAGFTVAVHDVRPLFDAGPGARGRLPADRPGGVWIMHLNAPDGMHAMAYLDPAAWRGRYRIGYWAYELSLLPKSWARASAAFHELWAPSRFVADAMAASGITRPIRVMPHPVALNAHGAAPDRTFPQRKPDEFIVLAMGDLRSSAERKNLIGAIEIFKAAFPAQGPGARLILKLQSAEAYPRFHGMAHRAIGGRGDVEVVAKTLPEGEIRRLIGSCDVLLSPHRSEGFGLPLAEAFVMGVPTLATGWSGNLDFMTGIPELLIDCKLVGVRDAYGVYKDRDLSWAEPNLADGAAKLAALAASPDLRRKLAARGKAAVEAQLACWSRDRLRETALGRLVD